MPDAAELLAHLDPEQREVAQTLRGPVCIIAGAGTGKTRALTHRIAYGVATGVYRPTEVLAVTFTRRAAGEMRERLRDLGAPGVQTRTFHSAALKQAQYFWPRVYGTELPQIINSKFGIAAEAAKREGIRADQALLRDLSAEIEWAKVSNVRPDDYVQAAVRANRQVGDLTASATAALLAGYEEVKRGAGRIDMEDILLITAALLADDERVAAQVRRQYRWFVVDEFQDVNPLQSRLLELWLGGRDDVCVVGDPRQTIYSFAGASPKILTSFTRTFPEAERHELVRNYRSTPQIVAVANAVFGKRSGTEGVRLQAQKEPGHPVTYSGHPDEPTEAQATASEIAQLHSRGMPYREMAILFRINAQSEAFEEALGERGIPYTLRGGEGFFQRAEVRQAVALLRGAALADQPGGEGMLDEARTVLASMGYTAAPPSGQGAVRDRWESLHAIITMAADLVERDPEANLVTLVADLDRRVENAHAPTVDGVTLATLHSAKGLEWDAVFCVGMHEGMMPSLHADTPAAVEEERRLFYVGVTRARQTLVISWSATRNAGGKGNRQPTRFLDALVPREHAARQVPSSNRKKRALCRVCRRPLSVGERKRGRCEDCPATYDEALYESLREWRSQLAREQSVPAYVIFNDATLQTIADVKPTDASGLARIPGVGPAKLEKYSDDVLGIINAS